MQEALDLPKPTFADDFVKAQGLKTSRRHAFEIHQPKLNPVSRPEGIGVIGVSLALLECQVPLDEQSFISPGILTPWKFATVAVLSVAN